MAMAEMSSSHSVKLKHPPKAFSLIESLTPQSESKKSVVRSLSMTEPNNSAKLEHQRQHRSYGDNVDRFKRHDSPGVISLKSHELSLEENVSKKKRRLRKSRQKSHRRFYEPSVERFPPARITRSHFKSIQEMPFWRLDASKFRRTVSAFETREMANARWRERTLLEMPFASQPWKKLVNVYGQAGADKLERCRLKCEKKMAKRELRRQRKEDHEKRRKEMTKSRESRLTKAALKKTAYEKIILEKELTEKQKKREESIDYNLGGLEVIILSSSAENNDKDKSQETLSQSEVPSKIDQSCINMPRNVPKCGDVFSKKATLAVVSHAEPGSCHAKPPVGMIDTNKNRPKGKVAEAISALEASRRNESACRSCERKAYTAERIVAKGQVFHNACFRCATCSTLLTRGNWNHDNDKFYCNPCHRKFSLQTLRH